MRPFAEEIAGGAASDDSKRAAHRWDCACGALVCVGGLIGAIFIVIVVGFCAMSVPFGNPGLIVQYKDIIVPGWAIIVSVGFLGLAWLCWLRAESLRDKAKWFEEIQKEMK